MKACQIICVCAASVCAQSAIFELETAENLASLSEPVLIPFTAMAGGSQVKNASGLSLDTGTHTFSLQFVWGDKNGFKDLKTAYTGASIRTVGGSGDLPVVYNISRGVTQQSTTDGGLFGYQLRLVDLGSYTVSQQEHDLLASKWFLTIESSGNPHGELRSQLTPVPEPEFYAMAGALGLVGFAVFRRVRGAACQPCAK
jgi:hypothetical protein